MNFFPFRAKCPPPPSLTEQLANAMRGRATRVLFLEDDRIWRELVSVVSQDYNVELVEVSSSGVARDILAADENFDAVILDIGVANGDGIELYRWLKLMRPKLHVIFLTGQRSEEVAERVHAVGSAPIYFKPAVMTANFLSDLLERLGARKRCPA